MVKIKKKYRLMRTMRTNRIKFLVDEEDYPLDMIEDELENDGINPREEGFLIGYKG